METLNARKHEIGDDCNDHNSYRDSNFKENIHKGQGSKSATALNISWVMRTLIRDKGLDELVSTVVATVKQKKRKK
jgi:hypothetical protein